MNILEQRAKNKIKIQVLKKMLEESTKKKVELTEGNTQNGFKDNKTIKQAVKKLVSKELTAGQALILAQKINDSHYLQDDLDLEELFAEYGVEVPDGYLSGGIEQLLQKIGYVLTGQDVDTILKKDKYGASEIGSILVKLFYSGEAQKFISNEFIKATATKIVKDVNFAKQMLTAITGGDPLEQDDYNLSYYQERAKPILKALNKHGLGGSY